MSHTRALDVEDEPVAILTQWQVFETETGEHHFCGITIPEQRGRTTSPIVAYDADGQVGQTRSGRIYLLHGPPTPSTLIDAVWGRWCDFNNIPYSLNVSEQYGPIVNEKGSGALGSTGE